MYTLLNYNSLETVERAERISMLWRIVKYMFCLNFSLMSGYCMSLLSLINRIVMFSSTVFVENFDL